MFHINVQTHKGTRVADVVCQTESCFLGKDEDCLVNLHGWFVAKKHARLQRNDDGVHISDISGKAGVRVNGEFIKDYGPLSDTDLIEINAYTIKVKTPKRDMDYKPQQPVVALTDKTVAVQPMPLVSDETTHTAVAATEIKQHVSELRSLRSKVHAELLKQMDLRRINVNSMSDDELRSFTERMIQNIIEQMADITININRAQLAEQVLNEAVGLGPLESLIAIEDISEIMVNAADEIFYEKAGRIYRSEVTFTDDKAVLAAIERIVTPLGRRIDEASPTVDARLKDGSRVNAVVPPIALKGPCITIRKFMKEKLTAQHIVNFGSVNEVMVRFLEMAVKHKQNIIISGGTGSGKTTLLNVLSNFIPRHERVITVEDAAELKLYQENLISLEARPSNQEGKGEVPIRELVKNCLRMRPDRIVVGECRGGEALDMLQAMNTGHDGSLTTAHANSPRDCISRLEVMVMMAGMELPILAIREQISSAVNIIVQQTRFACGTRKVTSICEVSGVEGNRVQLGEIFRFQQTGYDEQGRVQGKFVTTGIVPQFYEDLAKRGIDIDLAIFAEGRELL
ncbi:pilus assembly protein CpaF [Rheinheimera pacifica]|uniref:Pilus assembly protein CpaF n=1 Tax=Rheinheimera pacifica TaxID=173990 RepID=A0A1H6L5D1_9GAMM|nr:ATPase, T2SS/T4P/T4SS family [Rheinheimera pacifica]SEH81107.1 pilus assembly protein CpaF [Rheinheimera pacifica]